MRYLEQIRLNIWENSVKNQFLISLFRHLWDVIMLVHHFIDVDDLVGKHLLNFFLKPILTSLLSKQAELSKQDRISKQENSTKSVIKLKNKFKNRYASRVLIRASKVGMLVY